MDNVKDDAYYVNKIKDDAEFINAHMKGISLEELSNNEILNSAMSFKLIQICENSKQLSDKYKQEHNSVPWKLINGLRNRIVHDYGGIKYYMLYSTLIDDIPSLLKEIKK